MCAFGRPNFATRRKSCGNKPWSAQGVYKEQRTKGLQRRERKTVERCQRPFNRGRGCSSMSLWEKSVVRVGDVQQSLVSWEAEGWHVTGKSKLAAESTVGHAETYQIGAQGPDMEIKATRDAFLRCSSATAMLSRGGGERRKWKSTCLVAPRNSTLTRATEHGKHWEQKGSMTDGRSIRY